MRRFAFYLLFPLLLLSVSARAETITSCPKSKGYARVHHIHGFDVRLSAAAKSSESDPDPCRGSIARPGAAPVVFARALSLWIDDISGADVNGDAVPDVVFGGYSLDHGCCYDYTIVSLGKRPAVLREIHNQAPLRFRKENDGSVTIRTGDGSFDLFLLPHSKAVLPELTLRLTGEVLTDVSSQYLEDYDKQIASARAVLTPDAIQKFRASDFHKKMLIDQTDTMHQVLTVVLNYLYSGREAQAWQALDEMWPPADAGRVRSLIEERRSRGLLTQLSGN
jgi:hypothetical protein